VESQEIRHLEAASVVQVASGSRPGEPQDVSLKNVHDAEVVPTLLNPLWCKLDTIYAEGAFDSKTGHKLIARKAAIACFPPRKNAGDGKRDTHETPPWYLTSIGARCPHRAGGNPPPWFPCKIVGK